MESAKLEPWMLLSDWRADERTWLWVDLASWPEDLPLDPLPPVPVIGVGPSAHPQAGGVDAVTEPGFSLSRLADQIAAAPQAAAAIVQLLRATEGLAPARALVAESFAYAMLQHGGEHAAWLKRHSGKPATPAAAPSPPLRISRAGDRLDVVMIRPANHNAIDRSMRDALFDAFTLAAMDETITAVQVSSEGRVFSVGADLGEFGTIQHGLAAHQIRVRTLPAWPMIRRAGIYHVHVQGGCVGSGLELAAFAGRITASSRAWFQLPELAMGILPGFGGCVSLPRRIGRQRAALLILSGRRIDASTALAWGLVDALAETAPEGEVR